MVYAGHCHPRITGRAPACICRVIEIEMAPGTFSGSVGRGHEEGAGTCMGYIDHGICIISRYVHAIGMACDAVCGCGYILSTLAVLNNNRCRIKGGGLCMAILAVFRDQGVRMACTVSIIVVACPAGIVQVRIRIAEVSVDTVLKYCRIDQRCAG